MNVDDKDTAEGTDLGLDLGNSSRRAEKSKDDSCGGDGANAGLRIDMTFVDTDPMSELVWSPEKGLSLKCANGCFPAKRSSVLWSKGPSKMGNQSSTGNPAVKETFVTSLTACNASNEASRRPFRDEFQTAATDGQLEEVGTATATSGRHREEDMRTNESGGARKVDKTNKTRDDKNSSFPADKVKLGFLHNELDVDERSENFDKGNCGLHRGCASESEVQSLKEFEDDGSNRRKDKSTGNGHEKSFSFFKEENGSKKGPHSCACPLRKMESIAENDLPIAVIGNTCSAVMGILDTRSSHKVEKEPLHDEMFPEKTLAEENGSPTNSKARKYRMKGKAKVLSDGHDEEVGNEEDEESHESVESCNSAGLFSVGRKRWYFERQPTTGSKRLKTQVQDSPNSSTVFRGDSSFMSWISNMMKGLSKSNEDELPCLALTLANPNKGSEIPHQSPSTCKTNQCPKSRTTGFHSVFKSLYCPKTEANQNVTTTNDGAKGCKDLEPDNKICDTNATPIACRKGSEESSGQLLLSNENLERPATNEAHLSVQPKDLLMAVVGSRELNKSSSMENKSSRNTVVENKKDGESFDLSLGKHKTKSSENIYSDPSAEEKRNDPFCSSSGLLSSMWITRFTKKSSGLLLETLDKNSDEVAECSIRGLTVEPPVRNRLGTFISRKFLDSQEDTTEEPVPVRNNASSSDTSFGFYKMKGPHYEKFISKSQPVSSSSWHNKSEAMASVFARRLDALKNIIQLDAIDIAAHENTTCFFCGKKGHHLRDCSEITDNELEDLLQNVTFCDGSNGLTCICIKCFQLNHWAVACPNTPSSQAQCGAYLVNECGSSKMDLNERLDEIPKLSSGEVRHWKEDDHNSKGKPYEATSTGNMTVNLRLLENDVAACSSGSHLKENRIFPSYSSVDRQILDVPFQVFDAVNSLRLSRTDIHKWMNSQVPISCLDGFFLRLRLGKWEEGLGGTGYHVACITESKMEVFENFPGFQKKNSPRKSRNFIPVDVGGIRCSVESKYISNHDFQKDELMAWWSTKTKSGGKIPSEEDLKQKMKEKAMLLGL